MSSTAEWYVVHTYSGYENKVSTDIKNAVENRNLKDLIEEVLVPTETVTDERGKEYERKVFPGYVLIKMVMTDDSWYVVRNIRGVTGFVGPGSKPVPLSDEEVAALGVGNKAYKVSFEVGDTIQITGGSFDGFTGSVTEIDAEHGMVKALVSMFGRETTAELEISQVKKLD